MCFSVLLDGDITFNPVKGYTVAFIHTIFCVCVFLSYGMCNGSADIDQEANGIFIIWDPDLRGDGLHTEASHPGGER